MSTHIEGPHGNGSESCVERRSNDSALRTAVSRLRLVRSGADGRASDHYRLAAKQGRDAGRPTVLVLLTNESHVELFRIRPAKEASAGRRPRRGLSDWTRTSRHARAAALLVIRQSSAAQA